MQQQSQPRNSLVVLERENFLMFIKILFKLLESDGPQTKLRAQRIVQECKRRSQQGDPGFQPMMEAVSMRVRAFVGELKWRRAHMLLQHYISTKQRGGNAQRPRSRPVSPHHHSHHHAGGIEATPDSPQ